ncbi:LolA family protein [Streptomyces clavuligerus]|uniref:Putative membrane protein n=1 Tax=Streptomyces clavuligerus TaxID=1901 RepID=B5GWG6_STRCL|nr:hypothetical protein [Streptomyces clavuligerus]EDY50662.1 conserved hypothetical protein [Streptomyces clavuligerus]EFG08654.1 Putative membrane protein [Streptomyces clavuligerus]MBY6303193.1 DUF2092 domain-containing protein [Streptomyces clavuligerus]QCS06028.1 DUF2092 domain-containing protein [Streptomyces clavuligerus]QPJ94611.1 DUF2092 domain-containing protein [Streptomyces clavuligerus]
MEANDSARSTEETQGAGGRRKKAARYAVPVAVAGIAAATIGLVPALAASGDPDLPDITAQQLIEKIAASETQQLSGTVKITTDLGLPGLDGLEGLAPGALGSGGPGGSSADPQEKLTELASGGSHTLRIAIDGPERQKLSVLDETSEYSVIHNGGELWAYNSESNEVYHEKDLTGGKGHGGGAPGGKGAKGPDRLPTTPQELARTVLDAARGASTSVEVDGTAQIAGRDAYQLAIKPEQSGSTIGSIKIAVDERTGTPLRFTVNPSDGGKAAIDIGFTKVNFAKPAPAMFDFTPPKGAKLVEGDTADRAGAEGFGGLGEKELKKLEGEFGKDLGKDFGKDFEKDLAALEKEFGAGTGQAVEDLGKDLGKDLEKEFGAGLPGGGLNILGKDWTSIATFKVPGGGLLASASEKDLPEEARGMLDMFGDKVSGDFGSGKVFTSRLVNALVTDDGTVYAGAVTQDALVKAANAAK